jgi:hypothetical protein
MTNIVILGNSKLQQVLNEDTQVDLFLPFISKQKPAFTKHI